MTQEAINEIEVEVVVDAPISLGTNGHAAAQLEDESHANPFESNQLDQAAQPVGSPAPAVDPVAAVVEAPAAVVAEPAAADPAQLTDAPAA